MTVRAIATVGHPVLRERAREVTRDKSESPAEFERFHRKAFMARITEFVERVGS